MPLYIKVPYLGVAHNEHHETWLMDVLKRMFVSMIVGGDVVADTELIADVEAYLKRSAESAKKLLPKFAVVPCGSIAGDDDSDDEE